MKKIIVAALLALSVAGCQHDGAPVSPTLAAIPVPTPQPVVTRDVQWKVYTAKDIQQLAAEMKKSGKNTVIIGLTPQGYQNLSTNMTELERYIREQKEVIVFLKNIVDERGNNQPAS